MTAKYILPRTASIVVVFLNTMFKLFITMPAVNSRKKPARPRTTNQ